MTDGDDDYAITEMMRRYGGSFVQRLADAFRAADAENQRRLKAAFPEYWGRYRAMTAHKDDYTF